MYSKAREQMEEAASTNWDQLSNSGEEILSGLEGVADRCPPSSAELSSENPEQTGRLIMNLGEALKDYGAVVDSFCALYLEWMAARRNSVAQLRKLAKRMDKHRRNTNITSIAASGAGIVGGAMVIGGLVASPYTAGTSLALTAAGTGIGLVGGLTAGGASLTDFALKRKHAKRGKRVLQEDKRRTEQLQQCLIRLTQASEKLGAVYADLEGAQMPSDRHKYMLAIALIIAKTPMRVSSTAKSGARVYRCFRGLQLLKDAPSTLRLSDIQSAGRAVQAVQLTEQSAGDVASVANLYRTLKSTGTIASKTARAFSGVLSAIGIALDVWNIVSVSKSLSNESRTNLGIRLRNTAQELENEEKSMEGVYRTITANSASIV